MKQVTIPIEDDAIPNGWELYRIGSPKGGESVVCYGADGKPTAGTPDVNSYYPELIIRKKYDPGIRLPSGWWVWRADDNYIASKGVEIWIAAVCGLQFLPGFIPPEDGKPRQIP